MAMRKKPSMCLTHNNVYVPEESKCELAYCILDVLEKESDELIEKLNATVSDIVAGENVTVSRDGNIVTVGSTYKHYTGDENIVVDKYQNIYAVTPECEDMDAIIEEVFQGWQTNVDTIRSLSL